MASRRLSRFAQPLSEHRSAFAGDLESARPEYPDTVFEAPVPRNDCLGLERRASDESRVFASSKLTLPPGELYGAADWHNLVTYAEGQSALDSCLC